MCYSRLVLRGHLFPQILPRLKTCPPPVRLTAKNGMCPYFKKMACVPLLNSLSGHPSYLRLLFAGLFPLLEDFEIAFNNRIIRVDGQGLIDILFRQVILPGGQINDS
jgi:hypothetical protein